MKEDGGWWVGSIPKEPTVMNRINTDRRGLRDTIWKGKEKKGLQTAQPPFATVILNYRSFGRVDTGGARIVTMTTTADTVTRSGCAKANDRKCNERREIRNPGKWRPKKKEKCSFFCFFFRKETNKKENERSLAELKQLCPQAV